MFIAICAVYGNRYIAIISNCGIFLYELLWLTAVFRSVNNLELWVDEIGVINITHLPFSQISREVLATHVVPQLDYWNMWLWNKLSKNVLVGVGAAFDFIAGTKKNGLRYGCGIMDWSVHLDCYRSQEG